MQNSNKKRICIVSRSLGEGGSDRVASLQSIFFSNLGYDVFLVTILNFTKYPYKGTLLNLGKIKEVDDTFLGRFRRLIIFRDFIKNNKIDVIIDHRVRKKIFSEAVISLLIYGKKAIYVIHNYTIDLYFPKNKWIAELCYRNSKKIVAVSNEIEEKVKAFYSFQNTTTIYNPVDFDDIELKKEAAVSLDFKYVFWYGRFEDKQKNLSLLVEAYKDSLLPNLGIKLVIMGQGKDEAKIIKLIKKLNLFDNVLVLPFSKNPFAFINKSYFTVISSRYEGFPMTILESLACGVPVLSVNYGDAVNEILKSNYNGLIVDNFNSNILSDGLNRLVNDKELYNRCKKNAKLSVKKFSLLDIAKQWQQIIDN